jgi:amino acid adenylation domain-containing protein/non-ribosomal peptide synthase protein (TIGR01720 family)
MDGNSLTQRLTNLSPAKRALLELRLNTKRTPASPEQTIPPRASRDPAPLSFAQQRLWFLHQLDPESPSYNQPKAIRLIGTLDVHALQKALDHIVARHEALRTTFVSVDGISLQVIAKSRAVELPVIDLRQWPGTIPEAEVHRVLVETSRRPFDLSRDLMLRALLLCLADQEHILLLITHHIASDAWSSGILWQELTALYRSFSSGQPCPLPELSVQYADYAAWQRNWLQGEVLETQLSYWKNRLDHVPTLQLPTDRPRLPIQSFRGGRQFLALPKNLAQALKTLSRRENVTLFMTLLAAFQTLLHRYSGQDDIVVGSPIAGRTRPEIEGLIGFFVNTLVLRSNLSGNPSFREVMGPVREVALGAYAHQDLPFEKLVEELQPERNLSSSPLFQVTFALQNVPRQALEVPGLTLSSLQLDSGTAKFDLFLSMYEGTEGLRASLEYNTDLFDDETITRMLDHFQTLLKGIVFDPDQRLSDLPLLTDGERQQLLVEWNDTKRDFPSDKCIHELFEAQVERTPEAAAVVFGNQQLTYQELNRRANQLARYLQKLGVGPEVLVGICMERSLEMLVGVLGILKAGGAYVPLDPEYPKERLAFMLQDIQAPVLLTQEHLIIEDGRSRIDSDSRFSILDPRIQIVCLDRDWKTIAQEGNENPVSRSTAENLAYMIYTSGSTGIPKGAQVPHRGVTRLLFGVNYVQLDATDTFLQLAPLSFDASTFEIWGALLHGARLVLFPERIPTYQELNETIQKQSVSTLWLTSSLFNSVIDEAPEALSGIRQLLIGGEALSMPHVQRGLKLLPSTQILNGYGPTESTTFTCCYRIPKQMDKAIRSIPIGSPISNTEVYLLDHYLNPVPIGVRGELYIGGTGLARGYLNDPELTAEKFIPNPFSHEPGERVYKTGDLARYLPDGNIEFLGRLDHQVKIRGFRIELGEIEAVVSQHPSVRDTVVLVRENVTAERDADNLKSKTRTELSRSIDPSRVSGLKSDKRLVAYVVPKQEPAPTVSELGSFLKEKLPDYMVPSVFMFLDTLPLTPNGKLDRRALPVPDEARAPLEQTFVASCTPVEEKLAMIWCQVLGVKPVGVNDNFFALGGDSILSIQIIARANQAGLRLTPKQLFQHQTVAELAKVAYTAPAFQAEQGAITGKVHLTPIQHWFFEQQLPDPHHWNMAVLLEVRQVFSSALLARAVHYLVRYHDVLRARFTRVESDWQQWITTVEESRVFTQVDLSAVPECEHKHAMEQAMADAQSSLNLSQGPVLRVVLFALGAHKPSRLLIVIHHLVVDGVSWRILLEDLQTIYHQLNCGEAMQLPPKTTSFKAWAERLAEHAQSQAIQQELEYWLAVPRAHISRLPVDYAGGKNTEGSSQTVSVSLSDAETRTLLQGVPKAYHTQINDVLLTALVKTFADWTGAPSLLIDLEGHGREELFRDVDLSRTVGWFTTIFPLLLDLEGVFHPGEALKSVKEQLRHTPNRGIGYGMLRYLCGNLATVERLQALPKPEVSFNYLGQFDQVLPETSPFVWTTQSSGLTRNVQGNRRHLLAINGRIIRDRLQVNWTYSESLYRRATIESLTQGFIEALRALIANCVSPAAGGYTPSDFPAAKLSQKALDGLIARLSQTGGGKST